MVVLALIEGKVPAKPGFVADANRWAAALDYSRSLHATLPFLLTLDSCSWNGELPASTQEKFESELRRGRMVQALLDHELSLALGILKRERVDVLLLKGAELGRRYYSERLRRPMTDIDLLVRDADFARTLSLFIAQGFRAVGRDYPGRFRTELSRDGNPVVEVHARLLAGETASEVEGYWRRSESVVFPDLDCPVRVLEATDNLSYLIRHAGVQHIVESPLWLLDVRQLIQKETIDWSRFLARAERFRFSSAAWFVLTLSRAEVPAFVLTELEERVSGLRRALLRRLSRGLFPLVPRSRLWTFAGRFLLRDGAGQALAYFLERHRRLAFFPKT